MHPTRGYSNNSFSSHTDPAAPPSCPFCKSQRVSLPKHDDGYIRCLHCGEVWRDHEFSGRARPLGR